MIADVTDGRRYKSIPIEAFYDDDDGCEEQPLSPEQARREIARVRKEETNLSLKSIRRFLQHIDIGCESWGLGWTEAGVRWHLDKKYADRKTVYRALVKEAGLTLQEAIYFVVEEEARLVQSTLLNRDTIRSEVRVEWEAYMKWDRDEWCELLDKHIVESVL